MASMLAGHPDVSFSSPKETHFFSFCGEELRFSGPGDSETLNRVAVTNPTEFRTSFGHADRAVRAEGSVTTLYYSRKSIPNIEHYADPDVRMVAVLRHPVDRAYSAFAYLRSRGFEPETRFVRALELESSRIERGFSHMWHLRAQGRYAEQLKPLLDRFGRERVLVVTTEELATSPRAVVSRILMHAGLNLPPGLELHQSVNVGGEPRSKILTAAISGVRRAGLMPAVRCAVSSRLRERFRSATLRRSEMAAGERRELDAEFEPEIESLRSLLGSELYGWRRTDPGES